MEVIDFTLSDKEYKHSAEKAITISKMRLDKGHKLYFTLSTRGRGGRGLGKFNKVTEIFFDSSDRMFVGYKAKDRSGSFYEYAIIGRLHVVEGNV